MILRRKHYKLPPVKNVYCGGQQEHGIRPGTIPVALIAGLGEACRIAEAEYLDESKQLKSIKESLIEILNESGLKYGINGDSAYTVDSTMSVHLDGVSSEALMLSAKQFCGVSNGSACNSNSYDLSYVLRAMSVPDEVIKNTIRISWGNDNYRMEIQLWEKSHPMRRIQTL